MSTEPYYRHKTILYYYTAFFLSFLNISFRQTTSSITWYRVTINMELIKQFLLKTLFNKKITHFNKYIPGHFNFLEKGNFDDSHDPILKRIRFRFTRKCFLGTTWTLMLSRDSYIKSQNGMLPVAEGLWCTSFKWGGGVLVSRICVIRQFRLTRHNI